MPVHRRLLYYPGQQLASRPLHSAILLLPPRVRIWLSYSAPHYVAESLLLWVHPLTLRYRSHMPNPLAHKEETCFLHRPAPAPTPLDTVSFLPILEVASPILVVSGTGRPGSLATGRSTAQMGYRDLVVDTRLPL